MSCSFCNLRGHNITLCDNIFIDIHFNRMKTIYINFLEQIYPDNVENYSELGKTILIRIFNKKKLRAVGVQYCWGNTRETKTQLISRIWNYFKNRIYYPPPLEGQLSPPDSIIDRTAMTRHNDIHTISSMRPYYSSDREVMNRELMQNNIIIRNLISDFDAVEDVEEDVLEEDVLEEDVLEEDVLEPDLIQSYLGETEPVRRYNITPTFIEDDGEGREEDSDCPICYETYKWVDLITLNCSHKFCGDCIATILERHDTNNPTCALCRALMIKFDIQNIEVYNLLANRCRHLNL